MTECVRCEVFATQGSLEILWRTRHSVQLGRDLRVWSQLDNLADLGHADAPAAATGASEHLGEFTICYGNVREWCQDWYDKDYFGKSPRG